MEHSSNPTSTNYRNPEWKSSSESRFQQKSADPSGHFPSERDTTVDIPVTSSSSVEQQRSYIPSGDQALFDQTGSHRDRSNFESPSKAFDSTIDNTPSSSFGGEGSSSLSGLGSGSGLGLGSGSGVGLGSDLGSSEGLTHRRRDTPYYRGPTDIDDDTQPLLGRSAAAGDVPFSKDSSSLVSNDQSASTFNKDSSAIPSGGLWSSGLSSVGTSDLTSGTTNVNDNSTLGLGSSSIGAGSTSYDSSSNANTFSAGSGLHDHITHQSGTSDLLSRDSTMPASSDIGGGSSSMNMPRTDLGGAGIAGADATWPGSSSSDAAVGSSYLGSGVGVGAGSSDIGSSSISGVERSGSNYDSMSSQAHASSLGFGDQSRINQDLGGISSQDQSFGAGGLGSSSVGLGSSSVGLGSSSVGLGSSSVGLGGDQSFGSSSLGESGVQQQNMSERDLAMNNWAPDQVNPAIAGDNVVATSTGQKIKEAITSFAHKITGKSDDKDVDDSKDVEIDNSNYNKDVSKDVSKDDQSKGSWFGGDSDKSKDVSKDSAKDDKGSWFGMGGDSDKSKDVSKDDQSKGSWFGMGGDSDKSKEAPTVSDSENPYITNEQRLHKLAAEEAAEAAKARHHE